MSAETKNISPDQSRENNSQNPEGSFLKKNGLFILSLVMSIAIAIWGVLSPGELGQAANRLISSVLHSLDWFFLLSATTFVLACIWLALGPYGKIKLGKDNDKPEFSISSWLAMLFAAGMGVGLLFWGVSEPVMHFIEPTGVQSGSPAAARQAMVITCFHWGVHAWAIYAITGLVLAYFGFRKGAKYLPGEPIRRVFQGSWVSPVAMTADIVGVAAVSLGIAGSIGMGLMQITSGVQIVSGIPGDTLWLPVVILACLVVAYMTSATTGLSKGIRILSNINMWLAVTLMLFVLLAGPTTSLLGGFLTSVGDYSTSLVGMSFRMYPYQNLREWTHRWTLTFFIFWMAWAPFVGVFIARISRGRTIREFVLGVLLVPTLFSILWFSIFGGSAIHEEMSGVGALSTLVKEDMTAALFTLFEGFPLSGLLSITAISLIFVFLVTSADSATFVLSMLTSQGNPDPPLKKKITWGIVLGGLGAALMFTGSVEALQAVVITGAVPFVFVMLLQLAALLRALKEDLRKQRKKVAGATRSNQKENKKNKKISGKKTGETTTDRDSTGMKKPGLTLKRGHEDEDDTEDHNEDGDEDYDDDGNDDDNDLADPDEIEEIIRGGELKRDKTRGKTKND